METLIALCVSCIIFLAFFAAAQQFQSLNWNLSRLQERDANLTLIPLVCAKWLAGAGNNRWGQSWEGIAVESGALVARSDAEGPEGFPDGQLLDSFEAVALRSNGTDFQLRSNGGTFQPAAKNVSSFSFELADSHIVRLSLTGTTDRPLIHVAGTPEARLNFDVYLWNYRPNLFKEKP